MRGFKAQGGHPIGARHVNPRTKKGQCRTFPKKIGRRFRRRPTLWAEWCKGPLDLASKYLDDTGRGWAGVTLTVGIEDGDLGLVALRRQVNTKLLR